MKKKLISFTANYEREEALENQEAVQLWFGAEMTCETEAASIVLRLLLGSSSHTLKSSCLVEC